MDIHSMMSHLLEEEKSLTDVKNEIGNISNSIAQAIQSGKLNIKDLQDFLSKHNITLDEMSATSGGATAGSGATFTPGPGMAYAAPIGKKIKKEAQNHRSPEKDNIYTSQESGKFKSDSDRIFAKLKSAKIHDGSEVKVGDKVKYGYDEVTITRIMKDGSRVRIAGKTKDGKIVTGYSTQYRPIKETKDKEPKLAAGERKHIYDVDKFGFTPAPSIPNRPSKGGFQYKSLWDESDQLQESYSRFKKAVKERNNAEQYHTGVGIVRKELGKISRMMEYLTQLKEELNSRSDLKEMTHTRKTMDKITEMIKSIYAKHKKLK